MVPNDATQQGRINQNQTATVVNINTPKTNITARRATMTAGVVNVRKQPAPPKRTSVTYPLNTEQRAELNELINDWVTTSNLVKRPLHHGRAFSRLFNECLQGQVAHLNEIEASEFADCRNWIKQQIRIAENSNLKQARRKPDHTKRQIQTIQVRCKVLGVPDEVRKQYQRDRWGHESLTEFSDSELEAFRQYVQQDNPSFRHKERINPRDQELRDKALEILMDELEAVARQAQQPFDRHALRYTKTEIHDMLKARDRSLFSISEATFEDFWKKRAKGICALKSGRRATAT